MSDRSKKISELTSIGTANNSIAGGDLIPVVDVSASATKNATLATLRKAVVQGPYASDNAANAGGVERGQLYYTPDGSVKVRLI